MSLTRSKLHGVSYNLLPGLTTPTPGSNDTHPDHAYGQPAAPAALAEQMLRLDRREAVDDAELARRIARATAEVVKRQVDIGLDIVSDGEFSKVSYATYVKERLTGFDGAPAAR